MIETTKVEKRDFLVELGTEELPPKALRELELAFGAGVPSFPVAALLIGYHLAAREPWSAQAGTILALSHAAWISVVLMGAAMGVMFAGFRKAGIPMGPDAKPPERVPAGVIALGGYANRLLVLCDVGWLLLIAGLYLRLS